MIKYIAIFISILSASPVLLSFLSYSKLISTQIFNKVFVYACTDGSAISYIHGKSFLDLVAAYILFISGTHVGIPILGNNKKGSLMLLLSLVPFVLVISSFKHSEQYRIIVFLLLLAFISILEKLYEMSALFPKWLVITRFVISSIIISMLFYVYIF